jgi:hypothetical protein
VTKAGSQIGAFNDRIKQALADAARPQVLKAMGEEAVRLIVKRTRLGYAVDSHGQERSKLKPLSAGYVHQREADPKLSAMTAPKKSNLTRTGQMLDSMAVIAVRQGSVVVGPTGSRDDGLTNAQVAAWVSVARPFNFLSRLEQEQLTRFYRNRFGDLLSNRRLT